MSASFKHGDIVQHNEDGRLGRIITTQDGFLNVEPEHFSSQEQWDARKVTIVDDPSDEMLAAVDARVDEGHLDGSGMYTGAQPPPSGEPPLAPPTDSIALVHPDPVMVASGAVHKQFSDMAAEAGLPDPFANPKDALTRAREAGMRSGLMLSEVDPDFAEGFVKAVEDAKAGAGEGGGSDQEPSAGSDGDAAVRKPRKPRA